MGNNMATVEFIEKIEELVIQSQELKKIEIDGDLYIDKRLTKVKPEECNPTELTSLTALVDFAKATIDRNKDRLAMPLQINVSYKTITLKSSLDKNLDRDFIAEVNPILPRICFDNWMSMEEFIIQLQTCFVDSSNKAALIDLVSKITDETKATYTDDGMGQKVTVTKGTGLKDTVALQPIVRLIPYRTYQEVEQVESMYLIRVRDGGDLKIIEADGGMWKMEAQRRVSDYLREELKDYIEYGEVVIIG